MCPLAFLFIYFFFYCWNKPQSAVIAASSSIGGTYIHIYIYIYIYIYTPFCFLTIHLQFIVFHFCSGLWIYARTWICIWPQTNQHTKRGFCFFQLPVFFFIPFFFFFFFVHNSRNKAGREATFSAGGRVKIRENERRFGSVQQLNGSLKRRHAPAWFI